MDLLKKYLKDKDKVCGRIFKLNINDRCVKAEFYPNGILSYIKEGSYITRYYQNGNIQSFETKCISYAKEYITREEYYQNGNKKSSYQTFGVCSHNNKEEYYQNGNPKLIMNSHPRFGTERYDYRNNGTLSLSTRNISGFESTHGYKIYHDLNGIPFRVGYKYDDRSDYYVLRRGGCKPKGCDDKDYRVMQDLLEVGTIIK